MVKIGVSQWCLDQQGPEAIHRTQELGLSGIQIQCYLPTSKQYIGIPKNVAAYQAVMAAVPVQVTSLALTILPMIGNDKLLWKIVNDSLNAAIQLNIPHMMLPSFNQTEVKSEADLDKLVALLHRMFDYAGRHNFPLTIASENTLSAQDNLTLHRKVDHPNFEIFLDNLNPILLGYPVAEYIDTLWDYKCDQVHIKDGSNGLTDNERLTHGTGEVKRTLRQLAEKQFSGYIILENDYSTDAENRIAYDADQVNQCLAAQLKSTAPLP